jgi:NAD(P)-dependent dehydrogenase (short-subunit alcohol dehydrogenase family)
LRWSVDVTQQDAVVEAIDSMVALDTLIANAGTVRSAPFLDISASDWRAHLDVNLTGAFLAIQAAAQRFVRDGTRGLLLATSSWVAQVPWPEIAAYTTSKAGLEMLIKQAARELAPHGIRANAVAPGIVLAGLAKHQLETEPQYAARAARVIPLGALQSADKVAGARLTPIT